jgi:hypothetical protein
VSWAPHLRELSFAMAGSVRSDEPAGLVKRHQITCLCLTELRFSCVTSSGAPDQKQQLCFIMSCAEELQECELTLKGQPVLGDVVTFSLQRGDDAKVAMLPGEVSAGEGEASAGGGGHERSLGFVIESGDHQLPGGKPLGSIATKYIIAPFVWVECSNDAHGALAGRWQMLPQGSTAA